jgi:hypothetical protein
MIIYGEVMDHQTSVCCEYISTMSVIDFPFTFWMVGAFGYNGNLKQLAYSTYKTVPYDKAICVADCHDSAVGDSYHFGDDIDSILAASFLLAIGKGIPLLFHSQMDNKTIIAGLQFFHRMKDAPFYITDESDKDLLVIQRGHKGLAIINKSAEWRESESYIMADFGFTATFKELVYPNLDVQKIL